MALDGKTPAQAPRIETMGWKELIELAIRIKIQQKRHSSRHRIFKKDIVPIVIMIEVR